MKIPNALKTERYYLAISNTEALSSWKTFEEATNCYLQLKSHYPKDFKKVCGIVHIKKNNKVYVNIKETKDIIMNEKIYIAKVNHCTQCPSCSYDQNITRWHCRKMDNRFIMWMSDNEDQEPIPDWCPLEYWDERKLMSVGILKK